MTRVEMPRDVWEYTPAGSEWWNRYADDAPVTLNATAGRSMPLRWMDLLTLTLVAGAVFWCAHTLHTQRVHAAAVAATPKFASFYNCKLMQPGIQPQQNDGDPAHTQFYPYNYTVCDGVQVTLWSSIH